MKPGYGYDDIDPRTGRRRGAGGSGGLSWEQVLSGQRAKARSLLLALRRTLAVAQRLADLQLMQQPEVMDALTSSCLRPFLQFHFRNDSMVDIEVCL